MAPTPEQKPDAFLSYTRFDNDFSGGAISRFRDQLAAHVRALTGKPFHVFQDVDGIGLGEHWPKKLDDMLNQTRFFMPILTPSFFESRPCRKELQSFLDAEAKAGRADLILPIYWTECELLDEETLRSEDPLAVILHERQHHDWRPLVFDAFESVEVQKSLQALARKIRTAKRRVIRVVAENQQVAAGGGSRAQVQVVDPAAASPTTSSGLNDVASTPAKTSPFLLPPGTVFRDVEESWCPEMVVIPAGVFNMGSPADEVERHEDEGPLHRVEIEKPFTLGRYPVTRGEFAAFVKATGHVGRGAYIWTGSEVKLDEHADWQSPGIAQNDRHPVVCVSHEDVLAYLAWLSDKTSRRYVLPSEAMWEYACRAGTSTPFWTGGTISTDHANYNGNFPYGKGKKGQFREATNEVDHFDANPFGLHDMHGNVCEWCVDRWHDNYQGAPVDGTARLKGKNTGRVVRGGSWYVIAQSARSAFRSAVGPGGRSFDLGFRCAGVQE